MITFTIQGAKHDRMHHIPHSDGTTVYTMLLNDQEVGTTHGTNGSFLVVNLFGQGDHLFYVDELEKNNDTTMTLTELFKMGKIISY